MQQAALRLCVAIGLCLLQGIVSQRSGQPACEQSSCYPATGDLLIGRSDRLKSSSTCGLQRPERYCIVSHLDDKLKCFTCDSRQAGQPGRTTMSHRIENIVRRYRSDWKHSWWQARNGESGVSIQLDLEAEFHFTHLIMRFRTFRPAAMFVERSYDFGVTWKVYRYFAYDCHETFPHIQPGPIRNIGDVICESRYSDVAPSTEGEVIFRVLPPSIEIEDPYAEEVQDLLKMTNLRVNFTKLHTLGDNLLDTRDEIKEKYYYAMYDMVVRGSCSCYGHASRCVPIPGQEDNPNMVHGKCECTHNTQGLNCEQCQDFYNDLPWQPARSSETNACQKCECNNHATRCHFDPAVYVATGRVSGGVCDDCQDNTMGRNCEECKPFFYEDPEKDIRDPHICKSCDCDPLGSEHGGECESRTDPAHNLVAGRCICKYYVEGIRCSECRSGYWNMRQDNPEGCEACSCHTLGTVGNYGCDKRTGECRCKRFVAGRDCDQCLPKYWGLSDDIDGCKPCNCNVGGSLDNNCDQQTGQCNCRPNIIGRHCDQARPGYFTTNLDYLIYEAEFAEGMGNTRVVIREPQPGREITWTGPGFMRVTEGDTLTFTVDDIRMSMEYDLIIRYEPQLPDRWEDIQVTVIREGPVDQRGVCANSIPQDDYKAGTLPQGSRFHLISPSSCFETGKTYKIQISFRNYKAGRVTPEASVLIDSIVLQPSVNSIPIFQGPGVPIKMREEFERFRCREQQQGVQRPAELNEMCKDYIFSISAIVQQGALECQCDPTGSLSNVCDQHGGQCECKHNVIGRRCDQCAPGTYNFGPQGCSLCNCNAIGSRDNFCDVTSGQCLCRSNVFGRRCDQCEPGHWGFPNCRPCQCNGRADYCEDKTGACIDCRGNTGGTYCERCKNGYFGDPRPGSTYGCRPCMCPGGAGSGFQHGDTCRLDTRTGQAICDCLPGYGGERCDRCADNYFGNPLVPGGVCELCDCNNNIDPSVPGSCDTKTGRCLRCIYNTEGFNCENCMTGYFGDATQQNCQACVCNALGSDRSVGACDARTGQCPCLPNVIGLRCDRCAANYWKIASGTGCEMCQCDVYGSVSQQCNEFDGQCDCVQGRGGRTCSDCRDDYWGDPEHQCYPCDCDPVGSATQQCDRRTGKCECIDGVSGHKCNHCARGTTGQLPHCVPCGECFNDWDNIIHGLKQETSILVRRGSDIKIEGALGAFDQEFRDMEDKLDIVKKILAGTNITDAHLAELQHSLDQIRSNLTSNENNLNSIDDNLVDTSNRVMTANNRIESIRRRVDALKKNAEELKQNATFIRELDVIGAYNSTLQSQRRSAAAQASVDGTSTSIDRSQQLRKRVDELIDRGSDAFDHQYELNEQDLEGLQAKIDRVDGSIVDLNEMVCDGRGEPCDALCGGAGCGKCGGLSCDDGSVTKAEKALDFARRAEELLNQKAVDADRVLISVTQAQENVNGAKAIAQMAYDRAQMAKNESVGGVADLKDLMSRITEFLEERGATAEDITAIAEEVLGMSISLRPEEIRRLAEQINETIAGLSDIDTIIRATRGDLRRANDIRDRADDAKHAADEVLATAKRIIKALKQAQKAQNSASDAIQKAENDLQDAEKDLLMIESEARAGSTTANRTLEEVNDMRRRLVDLKSKFAENEVKVEEAATEADRAEELASQAEEDADALEKKYSKVSGKLDRKYNETQAAKAKVDSLRDRAAELYQNTFVKMERLKVVEGEFVRNEKMLGDLSDQIRELNEQMTAYLKDIQDAARTLTKCGAASSP